MKQLKVEFNNAKIKKNFEEIGYFVLLLKRNKEFPIELRFINESVINYLYMTYSKRISTHIEYFM